MPPMGMGPGGGSPGHSERRRRRLRHPAQRAESGRADLAEAGRSAVTPELHDPAVEAGHRRTPVDERDGERGLRGLVGPGASQVSVTAALRARDASQPSAADLAEAERRVVVVRRNWAPREELPRTGR